MKQDIEISVTQAARMLNCSEKTVVNYCLLGKLKGIKNSVPGVWKVSLVSTEKLLKAKKG